MKMTLDDCAQAVQGHLSGANSEFGSVSIDSRAIKPGQLYVAIKGPRFDGNDFIAEAEQAGAIASIVLPTAQATKAHIVVNDTRLALAQLAGAWRNAWASSAANPPAVVGVTGSNGKTTVKEMVAAVLSVKDEVLFTQGNLNNDIGVPLTLLRLDGQHRYAVIEMGANHAGEIAYTSTYAQADVVIITNAGAAHIEGFGSLDGVAKAKGELVETLKPSGIAVLNHDDKYFGYWRTLAGDRKVCTFGLAEGADVTALAISTTIHGHAFVTRFELVTALGTATINLHLAGRHNVLNALAAAAAGLALGLSLAEVKQGLEQVRPVTGRLQLLQGCLGNLIIDDTYNANSASLKAGLDVLAQTPGQPWLVLGAFGELGPESPAMHADMGALIKASGVQRLWALGEDCKHTVQAFGDGALFFDSHQALIDALNVALTGEETILIKGSRAQRMENIAAALVENFRN